MAQSSIDIPASLGIQAFNLQIMTVMGNPVNIQAAITVKATGPDSMVEVNTFQYSVDGGSTYKDCTLVSPPVNMEIPASPTGSLTTLTWDVATDIGFAAINNAIPVRATFTDGTHISPVATGSVTIIKQYVEKFDPTKNGIKSNTAVGVSISIKGQR